MKKVPILSFFILILFMFKLSSCKQATPPYDGKKNKEQAKMGVNFKEFKHTIKEKPIYGVSTGNKFCKNPAILFIHGAPGDWKAWGKYLGDIELSDKTVLIAIDRPGYANSNKENPILSLKEQADTIINSVLKIHKGPFVLVGHSYGGAVQTKITIDYPKLIQKNIILAGALDPVIQKTRWYHHLANTYLIYKILPFSFKTATKEMVSLPNELHILKKRLKEINIDTTVIQGINDWLVPFKNAKYIKEKFSNSNVSLNIIKEQGHFIPWEQYNLVKKEILKTLNKKCN